MRKLFLYILCACVFASCGNNDNEINGHECVDLGLPSGLKWATCNVGASLPGQFGDYFGDWCDADAVLSWVKGWRMPTKDEFQELINKCKWEWTVQDYHHGYKVTGPNGKSIFLPAAGCTLCESVMWAEAAPFFGVSLESCTLCESVMCAEVRGCYLAHKEDQCGVDFRSDRTPLRTRDEIGAVVFGYNRTTDEIVYESYDLKYGTCSVRLVAD